jgi:hypothetical protein
MDLNAAKLANDRASRLTRASMVACFVIASGLLLASLAMAHGVKAQSTAPTLATLTLLPD